MTAPDEGDETRTNRDHLLPEENVAGSDAPHAQAGEILAESEERTQRSVAAESAQSHERTSEQAT